MAGDDGEDLQVAFVQMAPAAIPVLLLVPGPLWIRLVAILLGRLVGLQ